MQHILRPNLIAYNHQRAHSFVFIEIDCVGIAHCAESALGQSRDLERGASKEKNSEYDLKKCQTITTGFSCVYKQPAIKLLSKRAAKVAMMRTAFCFGANVACNERAAKP
jgi:hypothetical protein